MNRHVVLLLIPAAMSAALLASAGPAPAAFPGGNGKIAFASSRAGGMQIHVMEADGSNPTALTSSAGSNDHASWSPDGSKLAFTRFGDGDAEIYVMNTDGSNPTQLTDNAVFDVEPAWSPDGSKLAFSSGSGGSAEIYVMNADGSNPTRLTDNPAFDGVPDWQPLVAPPANTCGEVYARGATRENPTARFDLRARYKTGAPSPEGEIAYDDSSAGQTFHATDVTSFVIAGDEATIKGNGLANGRPVTYEIRVTDSKPDAFAIALSDGYSSRGDLDRGRVVIRRRC